MTTKIDSHHDGHGLNEKIEILKDEPGAGGASHFYQMIVEGEFQSAKPAIIQFQDGPRFDPQSIPGVTELALLAVILDRLESFQAGPYKCRENAIAITKIEEAMMWMKQRAHNRAKRGVLGTTKV